jgi:hypothetical protein
MDQHDQTCADASSSGKDRRRHRRYRHELPIELKVPTTSFPIQGKTLDISVDGCYVASPFTIPQGTALEVKLWIGDKSAQVKATVRTSDPGVGNGIEFLAMDDTATQLLQQFLANLDIGPSPSRDTSLRDQLIR